MAGSPVRLLCQGFIECKTFKESKDDLKSRLGLTDRDIDARLESLIWGLNHNADYLADRIGEKNLWVAVTDFPRLRIYLRPRLDVLGECELLWIEEVL